MNLFVLTPEEKRVVAFIMLMILVGVCVKEYRNRHPVPPVPVEVQKHPWLAKLPPLMSPSPVPSITPRSPDDMPTTTPRPNRSRKSRKRSPSPTESPVEEQAESDSGGIEGLHRLR